MIPRSPGRGLGLGKKIIEGRLLSEAHSVILDYKCIQLPFQLLLLVLFFKKGNVYTVGFELILGHAFSQAVSFSPCEEAGLLSSLPTKGHGCFHVRLRVGRHRDDMQQCQSFGELSIPSIPCHGDLL